MSYEEIINQSTNNKNKNEQHTEPYSQSPKSNLASINKQEEINEMPLYIKNNHLNTSEISFNSNKKDRFEEIYHKFDSYLKNGVISNRVSKYEIVLDEINKKISGFKSIYEEKYSQLLEFKKRLIDEQRKRREEKEKVEKDVKNKINDMKESYKVLITQRNEGLTKGIKERVMKIEESIGKIKKNRVENEKKKEEWKERLKLIKNEKLSELKENLIKEINKCTANNGNSIYGSKYDNLSMGRRGNNQKISSLLKEKQEEIIKKLFEIEKERERMNEDLIIEVSNINKSVEICLEKEIEKRESFKEKIYKLLKETKNNISQLNN